MSGKKTWRLSKTLSRRIEVRPIEDQDVKYAWAAYKTGKLPQLNFTANLMAPQFKLDFETFVLNNAHAAWTVIAQTAKGFIPIGIVLGQWGPSMAYMTVSGIAWYPWASRRNIVEGTVSLFNKLRKEMAVIGFATDEHKPLYVACMKHGIMNRIGTSHCMGTKMAVFEVIRK